MTHPALYRSFIAFHLTLGLVIALQSAHTLLHALGAPAQHLHLGALAAAETLAAILFLWPRTLRAGGVALLAIFLVAVVAHVLRGEFPGALLVYAAGALFITVHGSGWPSARRPAEA